MLSATTFEEDIPSPEPKHIPNALPYSVAARRSPGHEWLPACPEHGPPFELGSAGFYYLGGLGYISNEVVNVP